MIVRLRGDVSGIRDGQPWPPRGSTIDLPDDEALALCSGGMAVPVPVEEIEKAVVADEDVERRSLTTEEAPALGRKRRT